jgi:hypothetical protein
MGEIHTEVKTTFGVRNRHNRQTDLCPLALLAFRSPFRVDNSF